MTGRIRIGGSFRTLRDAAAYRAECMDPEDRQAARDWAQQANHAERMAAECERYAARADE